jgi:hypothetical protein
MPTNPQMLSKSHANPQPASLVRMLQSASQVRKVSFFNNTYLLQKDRKFETFGTVKVRSADLEKCRK